MKVLAQFWRWKFIAALALVACIYLGNAALNGLPHANAATGMTKVHRLGMPNF